MSKPVVEGYMDEVKARKLTKRVETLEREGGNLVVLLWLTMTVLAYVLISKDAALDG
jgi:hypothetical protein